MKRRNRYINVEDISNFYEMDVSSVNRSTISLISNLGQKIQVEESVSTIQSMIQNQLNPEPDKTIIPLEPDIIEHYSG